MIGNLNHNAEGNRSGIQMDRFYYVPVEDVRGEDLYGLVVLKPGKQFFQGDCTRYSSSFNENPISDPNGKLINPEFMGVIPKLDSAKKQTLDSMDNRRFVLLYKDKNGGFWQVGGHQQGLRFNSEKSTGEGAEGRNAATVRFSAERMKKEVIPYNKELILETTPTDPENPTPEPEPTEPAIVKINGFTVASLAPGEIFETNTPFTLNFELQ